MNVVISQLDLLENAPRVMHDFYFILIGTDFALERIIDRSCRFVLKRGI